MEQNAWVHSGLITLPMLLYSMWPGLNASDVSHHTPSLAFRHLPPNSARSGYVTEGALFISVQLPADAVRELRKVQVVVRLGKQRNVEARTYTWGVRHG